MKTKNLIFAVLTIAATMSTGCFSDDNGFFNCEKGEGDILTETRNIDDFQGIELDIAADIFLTQGDEFLVEIEGQENILDELDLDVKGDVLEIGFDDCVRDYDDLIFRITMPELDFLSIKGSGKIITENFFSVNDLELKISGSGDMDLGLNADDLETRISGSGKLLLEGAVNDFDAEISGSGDVRAFGLVGEKVDIKITGSGDMEVYATDKLDIKITGSGDVYYRGTPEVNVDITGSGDVINAN